MPSSPVPRLPAWDIANQDGLEYQTYNSGIYSFQFVNRVTNTSLSLDAT